MPAPGEFERHRTHVRHLIASHDDANRSLASVELARPADAVNVKAISDQIDRQPRPTFRVFPHNIGKAFGHVVAADRDKTNLRFVNKSTERQSISS